jgi:hypothetical protein
MEVSQAELDYVERYNNTAAMIANDAMAARAELSRAITGWDGVLAQAEAAKDFTRKASWEAITLLDLRLKGRVASGDTSRSRKSAHLRSSTTAGRASTSRRT